MIAALHDQPLFSELFMAYLLTRNSRIEEDLIDQLFNSSEKRLARLLLLLANFGKEGSPQPITPNISQETLAEMIGTTRSRVSFFMNKFRKLGLISYNGKIEVNSSLLNAVLYDKPLLKQDEVKETAPARGDAEAVIPSDAWGHRASGSQPPSYADDIWFPKTCAVTSLLASFVSRQSCFCRCPCRMSGTDLGTLLRGIRFRADLTGEQPHV